MWSDKNDSLIYLIVGPNESVLVLTLNKNHPTTFIRPQKSQYTLFSITMKESSARNLDWIFVILKKDNFLKIIEIYILSRYSHRRVFNRYNNFSQWNFQYACLLLLNSEKRIHPYCNLRDWNKVLFNSLREIPCYRLSELKIFNLLPTLV